MTRTPARVTQADVARAIRAAKQAGAGAVEVLKDGTIRINRPKPKTKPAKKRQRASKRIQKERL